MSNAMSRRSFLRTSLVSAAVGAAGGLSMPLASAAPSGAAAPRLPYSADSYFRTPVVGAVKDSARTAAFRSFMKTHPDQKEFAHPRITGLGSNPWGTTFHLATASDPVWRLAGKGVRTETQLLGSQGVHIADNVLKRIPTGTQDREMLVVDPVYGYSVFIADCVPNYATRTITCSSSGLTWHSSNGLDRRNPRSNDKRNFTSRGRISDAGVIRPDLLQHGIANNTGLGHVLQFWFVETQTNDGFCHPMIGQEKDKNGFGAEGERVGIRADVDLKARGFTGAALVIARTLQQHGAYIGDNSGSSTMLKGAQSTATYNPYAGMNISQDCLKGLTWDDFVVYRR